MGGDTENAWKLLCDEENAPHVASLDCPPIIDLMSAICVNGAAAEELIERFADSRSLTYACSLAVVLCRYAMDQRSEGLKLLGAFYHRVRYRHHPGTVHSILAAADYCLAVTRLNIHVRDILASICDGALELCELDMASGRETRARSTLESVKSICNQDSEGTISEVLRMRVERTEQILIHLGAS